jgi:anti-sigma B factor antagonist
VGDPSRPREDDHPPDFAVTEPTAGVCVLAVHCEVDMSSTPELARLLIQELSAEPSVLAVDFSGCGFMSSSGLAALVEARERADDTDTTLLLVGLNRILTRALQATGLIPLFRIHPSLDEALTQLDHPNPD